MANEDENLVSEIQVVGGDEATAEVKKFADDSAEALNKLGDSSEKASDKVEKSTDKIVKNYKKTAQGAKQVGDSGTDIARAGQSLQQLEKDTSAFTAAIPKAAKEVGQFVKKLAALSTAAVAAGVGVIVAARRVAAAVDGQSDSLDKQAQAQIDANNAALQGELAQLNYESAIRQLNRQLATGQVTYIEYSKQVRALNDNYREQQRAAADVEAAQKRVKEENDRLTKSLADRKAYTGLIDTLGGPLLTALTGLGRTAEQTRRQFLNAFGPSAAAVVDVITNVLNRNSGAIGRFFDEASQKIQNLLQRNGPAIEKALESIGTAAKSVFSGLINAAPALLDFFNNTLVPAIQSVATALDGIATLINNVFGTQITGGLIAIVVILGTMTDAFKALFSVTGLAIRGLIVLAGIVSASLGVSMLAAVGIIAAVGAALYLLVTQIDWTAFAQKVVAAWQSIQTGATNAVNGIQAIWGGIVGWFQDSVIAPIQTAFTTLWAWFGTSVVTVVDLVKAGWNVLVEFFTSLGNQIRDAFNAALDAIAGYWQAGVNKLKSYFSDLYNSALQYLKPVIAMFKELLGLQSQANAGGDSGGTVNAATGGHITGAGTSTSDSILARLSNGEFVMKARAVAKYGVGLMHAINSGNFRIPQFAAGGVVSIAPAPVPSFAGVGGEAGSTTLQPLNLSLFGEEFKGLMMPEDVGRRMTKFAITKQTRSAGRKPAWIGRGRT